MNSTILIIVVVFCSMLLCVGLIYAKRSGKAQEVVIAPDSYEVPMKVISRRNEIEDDEDYYEVPCRLYDVASPTAIPEEEISFGCSRDDSMTSRTLESYVTCEP